METYVVTELEAAADELTEFLGLFETDGLVVGEEERRMEADWLGEGVTVTESLEVRVDQTVTVPLAETLSLLLGDPDIVSYEAVAKAVCVNESTVVTEGLSPADAE